MRIMGLDVGEARIGVAISDPTNIIASPLKTIHVKGPDQGIEEIVSLVEEHEIELTVVGLPISLSGDLGPQAKKIEEFCEVLTSRLKVPVVTYDERFSSVSADRLMREAGKKGSHQKGLRDAIAAAVILQSYLESRKYEPSLEPNAQSEG